MKKTIYFSIISIFNFILFFSMRSIWSGIEDMFGVAWLAYLLFGILVLLALVSLIKIFIKKNRLSLLLLIISLIFTIALCYMFYLGIGSYKYIIRTFGKGALYLFIIAFIIFMIFYFPKSKLSRSLFFKFGLSAILIVIIILLIFNLGINYLTNMPVVYAVESDYQIVWTTSLNSTGSVKVGNDYYHDLYAGSKRSSKVHKVIVPMKVLDEGKFYQIYSTSIIYRGPYSGLKGRTITKDFQFKPLDLSDGLHYYALSDTHEHAHAAGITGSYFGDKLDFLILLGDISSHLESTKDMELINRIAFEITKGQKPIVYARGNHEVKASNAPELHRYVGSKNENFYYTFTLQGVFGIVLDLGEDHEDSWWEFYDTAHFEAYRTIQTEFLKEIVAREDYQSPDIVYRMLISHIPISYVSADNFLKDLKLEWTEILNEIKLDIALSGHHHQLMPITVDVPANVDLYFDKSYSYNIESKRGFRTASNFNTFIVSRRSNVQNIGVKENLFGKQHSGLAAEVNFDEQTQCFYYTNTKHMLVDVINPFTGAAKKEFKFMLGE